MDYSISGIIAIFFALLLMALIVALIFRRDFRDAVIGGDPGEASIAGILTVKGAAIVLLCGLLIGGILFAITKLPSTQQSKTIAGPISVRLNVHFDPNDVNPKHPEFKINPYIKTRKGSEPIDYVDTQKEGALSIELEVPDMETPFFIVFETPRGTWQTDDFSIHETAVTARKQVKFP